jgi:hypothetical protein
MPNHRKDISGERFGKLVAIAPTNKKASNGSIIWKYQCDCGNVIYRPASLRGIKSCGCITRKHGKAHTKLYKIWSSMKSRCNNPNDKYYHNYGGRGITVCDRWDKADGFKNFYADVGEPQKGMSLDRIDNNKGYSPENCRWATRKEQQNNTRVNRMITINGTTKTIHQWCDQMGIKYETARRRIDTYGWSVEEAILTPLHGKYHAAKRGDF